MSTLVQTQPFSCSTICTLMHPATRSRIPTASLPRPYALGANNGTFYGPSWNLNLLVRWGFTREDVNVGLLGCYLPTSPYGVTTQKINIHTNLLVYVLMHGPWNPKINAGITQTATILTRAPEQLRTVVFWPYPSRQITTVVTKLCTAVHRNKHRTAEVTTNANRFRVNNDNRAHIMLISVEVSDDTRLRTSIRWLRPARDNVFTLNNLSM